MDVQQSTGFVIWLTGMKRAGTDMILTYHAKEAAEWLQAR